MRVTTRWRAATVAVVVALGPLVAAPSGADTAGLPAEAQVESRCTGSFLLTCERHTDTLWTGAAGITPRNVHWQVPVGTPPEGGWPAVVVFSPSFYSSKIAWSSTPLRPAGAHHQTETFKELLDNGYAVLTPESHLQGFTFWDTNVPLLDYDNAPDRYFVEDILDELGGGTFGPVNTDRLFAAGMSSGGYMTSRMAVSHEGSFQALAIQSASYADCLGPLCSVPDDLPDDHPPTLFLHGRLDLTVPISTMDPYQDRLDAQGTPTRTVVDNWRSHAFLPAAPEEILAWFQAWDPGA